MKYQGLIKKSRTYDFMAIIAVLGVVEQNLPLVRDQLGDYYGWVFIGIAVIGVLLRNATSGPVGEK